MRHTTHPSVKGDAAFSQGDRTSGDRFTGTREVPAVDHRERETAVAVQSGRIVRPTAPHDWALAVTEQSRGGCGSLSRSSQDRAEEFRGESESVVAERVRGIFEARREASCHGHDRLASS
jgi:hypothetical protein